MPIWKKPITLEELNAFSPRTLQHTLGIQMIGIGDDYLEGTLPVDERTRQPYGLLHGGASVALAETLGSLASYCVSGGEQVCVGIEISASHLRSVQSGSVTGRASPLRLGKSIHVWEIRIHETGKPQADLVCLSKLTVLLKASH